MDWFIHFPIEIFIGFLITYLILQKLFGKNDFPTLVPGEEDSVFTYFKTTYIRDVVVFWSLLISIVVLTSPLSTVSKSYSYLSVGPTTTFIKSIGLILAIILIIVFSENMKRNQLFKEDFFIIYLLSFIGLCLFISSQDLFVSFLAIEIQGLSFYILATSQRTNVRSTEAGLKYFILGSLSSAIFLFGVVLLYGSVGTTSLPAIAILMSNSKGITVSSIIGILFIIVSLLFKVGAAPFHVWLPDVYEGSPLLITAYFSIIPKFFLYYFIYKFIFVYCPWSTLFIMPLIYLSILSSFFVGSTGAIKQHRIKRVLGYSTIAHNGFLLMPILAYNSHTIIYVIYYLIAYSVSLVLLFGIFGNILNVKTQKYVQYISEVRSLYFHHKDFAIGILIGFMSLSGIPPLVGFFAKYNIMLDCVESGIYIPVIFAIVSSVVSAFYYLRLIVNVFFMKGERFIAGRWYNKYTRFFASDLYTRVGLLIGFSILCLLTSFINFDIEPIAYTLIFDFLKI